MIQLLGAPNQYRLETAPSNAPNGTAIFRTLNGREDLIGIVSDSVLNSLESELFQFV
ncbi:MAG: hypothetical protein RSE13_04305 [Planktothrix sp. GU0601_MAG3]|nr:MAG: hypothetical protein RSE13_04305 [Planktothrix sp. GU0601_MAG3]